MTYDALGDVASVNASLPAAPSSYSGTTNYQYDGKTELTQEASTRSGGYTNANSYDLAENPTQVRGVAQPTANADNQLPVTGVTYDGNGNPSKVEGLTAGFDIENRATALGGVANTWGGNGLRASKTTSSGTTYFLYDGSVPVCELSSTGAVTATNTFGGAGLISRHTSGGSTFYTFDAQGNVAQRYTSTGSLVSSDLYDAFGKGTSTGSGDVFGYEGQAGYYTDTTTGLILCGHRFYDSTVGRFVNRDPIGYAGGINLYGYTGNNASNGVDPSGFDENGDATLGNGGYAPPDNSNLDGTPTPDGPSLNQMPPEMVPPNAAPEPASEPAPGGGNEGTTCSGSDDAGGNGGGSGGSGDGGGPTVTTDPDGTTTFTGPMQAPPFPIYRGGPSMAIKPGEIKIDPNGIVTSTNKGPSLNTNPNDPNIQKYGGPYQVVSYPSGLTIIQQGGNPNHYVMAPTSPLPLDIYQNLLNQTILHPL